MKTIFMFSGLGSHYYQMGRNLYDQHPFFRRRIDELAEASEAICGENIAAHIYDPSRKSFEDFNATAVAGMGIVMVECAMVDTLAQEGIVPDMVLGSSMGLFGASVAAGCMSAQEAMEAVFHQATVFERYGDDGSMIAVLAPLAGLQDDPVLNTLAEVAAVNFDANFVLAAPAEHLPAVEARLRERAVVYQRMAIGRPFHSRWIDGARDAFFRRFATLGMRSARIPMTCCSKAGTFTSLTPDDLWSAVRYPIQLQDTILRLEKSGPWRYVDVGPSSTMATCLKYLLPRSSTSTYFPVMTPFGQDVQNFATLLERTPTARTLNE